MASVAWFLLNVRQAVRQLHARPGFTLAALIILSVGIGARRAPNRPQATTRPIEAAQQQPGAGQER